MVKIMSNKKALFFAVSVAAVFSLIGGALFGAGIATVSSSLSAMGGRQGPLRSHINGALNHGATPEQVIETLKMVSIYAGFPAALEAWPVMEAVFAQRGIPRPGRPS